MRGVDADQAKGNLTRSVTSSETLLPESVCRSTRDQNLAPNAVTLGPYRAHTTTNMLTFHLRKLASVSPDSAHIHGDMHGSASSLRRAGNIICRYHDTFLLENSRLTNAHRISNTRRRRVAQGQSGMESV
jgi:hypothetical protein